MKANELSCKDLMVGDWVKPKNVDAYFRVGLIGLDSVWNDTDTHEWDYNELEPILLTPEILEKNGFDNVIWQGEASWSYHENEVYVCISGRNGGIKHFGYNGWDSKIAISSVHELQHALRLCGIEKEIEL